MQTVTERGVPDTRMADIAERAGMSSGHVFYYFDSKAHILMETLRYNEDRFHESIQSRLAELSEPRERLRRVIELSAPEGPGDPHWVLWLEVWAQSPRDTEISQNTGLQDNRFLETIAQIIREGQAEGAFDAGVDPREFSVRLSALIDGLAIQVVSGAPWMDPARMIDIVARSAARELGCSFDTGEDSSLAPRP